jgi:hypothetical protein
VVVVQVPVSLIVMDEDWAMIVVRWQWRYSKERLDSVMNLILVGLSDAMDLDWKVIDRIMKIRKKKRTVKKNVIVVLVEVVVVVVASVHLVIQMATTMN